MMLPEAVVPRAAGMIREAGTARQRGPRMQPDKWLLLLLLRLCCCAPADDPRGCTYGE